VRAAAITDGGRHAVSISLDGALMWSLDSGEVVETFDEQWSLNPFRDTFLDEIAGPWHRVHALLPGGRARARVGPGTLQIQNYPGREAESPEFGEHEDTIEVLRATRDGRRAVTGTVSGIAKVWDLENHREIAALVGHSAAIVDLAVDSDARRVVTASMDGSLKVWDLDTGRLLRTLEGDAGALSAVALLPGSDYVVSAAQDQAVRVWDASSGDAIAAFTAEAALMSCAAAPDGVTIVAGEMSGGVHILRLEAAETSPAAVDPAWSAEPHRPDFAERVIPAGLESQSAGDYQRAEQLFALAMQVRLFLFGPADSRVAQSLNYLALMYSAQGHHEGAAGVRERTADLRAERGIREPELRHQPAEHRHGVREPGTMA
jgi:WD40 repeat protein